MMPDTPPVELLAVSSPETVAAHEDSTRKWARFQRAKYWAIALGVVVAVALIGAVLLLVAVAVGQNDKQIALTRQVITLTQKIDANSANTKQAVQILVDCTTPGHKCYEQGQQSTRTAVQGLIKAGNASEICGNDPVNDTLPELEACVITTLKTGHP